MDIDFVGLTAVTLIFGIPIVAIVSNAYLKAKKLALEKMMLEQGQGLSGREKQQLENLQKENQVLKQRLENLETIVSAIDVDLLKANDTKKIN